MRMSTLLLPIRFLATSVALLAMSLLAIPASSAEAETGAATPTETVAATVTSAAAEVAPKETASTIPVHPAEPQSAPSAQPESAAAPLPDTNTPSADLGSESSRGGLAASAVSAVEREVTRVADTATGAEAASKVKATVEKTSSAAAAPLADKVIGAATDAIGGASEVVEDVPAAKRLTEGVAPTHSATSIPLPNRPQLSPDRPPPFPGPASWLDPDTPSGMTHLPAPLQPRLAPGSIDNREFGSLGGALQALQFQIPADLLDLRVDAPAAGALPDSHASPGGAADRSPPAGRAPYSAGSSSNAAPGSGGGTSFVPIAALLALLALAAPAISRRAKEALVAPVPSLFVCALERPG